MLRRFARVICLASGLAACGMLPGDGGDDGPATAPSALAAEEIGVTPLDAPRGAEPAAPAAATPATDAEAPAASPWTEVVPAPPPPEAAPEVKSAGQIACEKQKGRYVALGGTGARTCVKPTRDGGKQCRKDGDCSGQCLARSNTCAPMNPLLGCNDILQSDGRRVTLCLD